MAYDRTIENPTPRVDGSRGAPMGRPNCSGYESPRNGWTELAVIPNAPPFHLRRVRLDAGGYDSGGAYWGLGLALYYFQGPVSDIDGFVRAKSRDEAKAEVRAIHKHARFFR